MSTRSLAHSHSPWVLILGRTLVDGDADVADVQELQEQYKLTPLSQWGKDEAEGAGAARRARADRARARIRSGPFKTLNAMLEENPPPAHHELLLKQFAPDRHRPRPGPRRRSPTPSSRV